MTRPFDKDEKKREIAAAALVVFAEQGFETASMRQVASQAGIGKGTIYEYYRSKDELISHSIRLWMEQMVAEAEEAIGGLGDPEEKLRSYVSMFVEMFLTDETMPRMIVSTFQLFITRLHDTTYGEILRMMFRGAVEPIEKILLEGMEKGVFRIESREEARKIAINLGAYLDGICLDHLFMGGYFDLREQVDHYMKCLLEADIK
jgi:AcrR family transcriptional regulator